MNASSGMGSPGPRSAELRSLRTEGVAVYFDGVRAVDGVDLVMMANEILGLIGPNGAGKTTLVNAMTGFQSPTRGRVLLDSQDMTRWKPQRIAREGVVRTFQKARSFGRLSVSENVIVGALGMGMSKREADSISNEMLDRTRLRDNASAPATSLTHGQERRLGVARALAMRPRFLILDEPGSGLNEKESDELVTLLAEVGHEFSLGMLVIEHDMRIIMNLCERIHVLDQGKTLAVGSPKQIRSNRHVEAAYLGS